ncbi:hypothetical protein [Streptomyces tendae]|nr:hypothetical protein [Streptomyces tendae]
MKAATDDADRDGMLMLGGNSAGRSDDGEARRPPPTPPDADRR